MAALTAMTLASVATALTELPGHAKAQAIDTSSTQIESTEVSEDDGNLEARPAEDLEPLEPEAGPSCPNPGWRARITGYDYNRFYRLERFSMQNRDRSGPAKTFNFEVSKSANVEFSYSANVSASAGSRLFGEIKAEVNGGIKLSLGYSSRYGGSMKLPPRTVGFAQSGFLRTIANSRMYLLNKNCERTQHKSVQGRAPWSSHWNTFTRKL